MPLYNMGDIANPKSLTLFFATLGAAVGLANSPSNGWVKGGISLATGIATSVAVGPIVRHYAGVPDGFEYGVAFILGAMAQRAVPPLLNWVERAFSDPIKTARSIFAKGDAGNADAADDK